MKTFLYLTGIASFIAGMVALLIGVSDFYAALFVCVGSAIAASSDGWETKRKGQFTGLAFLVLLCGYLLVSAFTEEEPGSFSGMRIPWIGIPLLTAVVVLAVLRVRGVHGQRPNQPTQRNAGSRPSPGDSPVSETSSSLGPRG